MRQKQKPPLCFADYLHDRKRHPECSFRRLGALYNDTLKETTENRRRVKAADRIEFMRFVKAYAPEIYKKWTERGRVIMTGHLIRGWRKSIDL